MVQEKRREKMVQCVLIVIISISSRSNKEMNKRKEDARSSKMRLLCNWRLGKERKREEKLRKLNIYVMIKGMHKKMIT